MPKIYTKTGDKGESSLWGGQRVGKAHPRLQAYGTVDELNSLLGLAHSKSSQLPALATQLLRIQSELLSCGSDLATPLELDASLKPVRISKDYTRRLEQEIDNFSGELPLLQNFILPGGSELAALLHVCRTCCRRAEREAVAAGSAEELNPEALVYLNRLSDWLFEAARLANQQLGVSEQIWQSPSA